MGNGRFYDPMKKIDRIVGFASNKNVFGFPGLGWGVISCVDYEQAMELPNKIKNEAMVSLAISLVLVCFAGYVLATKISSPIRSAVDVFQKIAQGDLTARAKIDSADEVGQLGKAANDMIDRLRLLVSEIKNNALGLNKSSEVLARTSEDLAVGTESVNERSNVVASAGEELSVNISQMSESANQMAGSTSMLASSIEEMSVSINEVAKNCSQSSKIADKANVRAKDTIQGMQGLSEATKEISSVVDFISNIADQTNLLALNATIEAASAGEQGRGFAVVANEVKELARQSAKATEEITKKIQDIQQRSGVTVEAINEVAGVIEEVTKISSSIAAAVEEQSATVNNISKTISTVSSSTKVLAQNVKEAALVEGLDVYGIENVLQVIDFFEGSQI
jgi:methyl-accepting chemotaxis protein